MSSNKNHQHPTPTKVLRIGVVQAGKIVEERLIRRPGSITIGSSPNNTITAVASNLPKRLPLFRWSRGHYHLQLGQHLDGRIGSADTISTLDQIRTQKAFSGAGDEASISLHEDTRGKVRLGEISVLFQFVTPAPLHPRPQLAPSLKGGVLKNINWVFMASFLAVGLVHFGFISYLRAMDIPRHIEPQMLPPLMDIPKLPPPTMLDPQVLKPVGEKPIKPVAKKGNSHKNGKTNRSPKAGSKRPRKPFDRKTIRALVSKTGLLAVLGNRGRGKSSTLRNLLDSGSPGRKIKQAFEGVSGVIVTSRQSNLTKLGKGSDRGPIGPTDIEGLATRIRDPGKVTIHQRVEEHVPKPIVNPDQRHIETGCEIKNLQQTIRLGMPAIRACYQRGLKRDPNLSGKITLRLSVNTMGRVISATVDGSINNNTVASCIARSARRWRFSPLDDDSTDVTVPFVLRPSR